MQKKQYKVRSHIISIMTNNSRKKGANEQTKSAYLLYYPIKLIAGNIIYCQD